MTWRALKAELDRWQADGRVATLWWRDDDASTATAALDALLAMRRAADVPLALAVIPAAADPSLATTLRGEPVAVLQHGWMHRNHAAPPHGKAEFGPDRQRDEMIAELKAGQERLQNICPSLPVLVPPWNRIDPDLPAALPRLGITGLSTIHPRQPAPPGLAVVNAHIDVMSWVTRRFRGDDAALAAAIGHLAGRREAAVDADEPTGILTHHLAHDVHAWEFIRPFLAETTAHPAARWISADALFGRASGAARGD
jgi:hypothetical protein